MKRAPVVIKVGGGLLRGAPSLVRVAAAIASRRPAEPVAVVASALSGVTDRLARAGWEAAGVPLGDGLAPLTAELRRRHEELARELGCDAAARDGVDRVLGDVERLLGTIAGERVLDDGWRRLLVCGECLSVELLAGALRAMGCAARAATPETIGLRATGGVFGAVCDLPASASGMRRLGSSLEQEVPVIAGFYGLDAAGAVSLFGRGGSDYTAGAIAAGLGARRLELWKDVPGLMTADPRRVRAARLVPRLSFDEAARLAAYGERVIHSRCLDPLRGHPTEVRILPLEGARNQGTRVEQEASPRRRDDPSRVTALAASGERAIVQPAATVLRDGNGERELLIELMAVAETTELLDQDGAPALVIGLDDPNVLEPELSRIASAGSPLVDLRRQPAQVGVVGDGVAGARSIATSVRRCFDRLGLEPAALRDAGDVGRRWAVPPARLEPVLHGLHEAFFSD